MGSPYAPTGLEDQGRCHTGNVVRPFPTGRRLAMTERRRLEGEP